MLYYLYINVSLFSTQNVNFQWLTYVKGIFDECVLTYIWNSHNFINERWIKEKLNNAYATSSNKIGMMIFKPIQKPLIIEFSKILLYLNIILTY